ncbi:MAG TPA: hypothetical protein PLA94_27455, partial [Myxococcota bacterium]|nr:hypothetical protein [Myxococcota bacterium]
MELTATIVGKQEDFDQLAIRAVILASDKKRYTCRVLDQKDNRDLVMDGQRRLLDAFELVERYDIPNTLRALGEFVDPDLGWRGWVTPLVSGCSLHLIQNLPNSGMILLLYEGCRTLDALDRLQENGKPLNAVLRSLDPRSIVISSSGKVTFTSLDHLRF